MKQNGGYTIEDWEASSKHVYDLPMGIASEALKAASMSDGCYMSPEDLDVWVHERLTRQVRKVSA